MEGLFVVQVIGCRLTRDTEVFGKMDPYCLLKTGDQKAMTSVKMDAGKVCQWNETFTFYVKEDDVVKFQVWDEDPGSDDLVGESFLNVSSSYVEKQSFSFALTYADKGAGELDLELQFFPQEKKRIEAVKSLQNLLREKQLALEQHLKTQHPDVEIISSPDDSKREQELRLSIEKDKAEIHALETAFKELFAQFDKELGGMNHTLAGLIKENNELRNVVGVKNAKLEEYKRYVAGGVLNVWVQKATILRDVESMGAKMDPFAVFYLGKHVSKTNVAKDQGKNPTWNQTLKLDRGEEDILRFEVIDYNELMKSQLIGYGAISLFDLVHAKHKKAFNAFLNYKGEKVGTIDLEVEFIGK